MEYNATCAICGKNYKKCNSCSDTKLKPWLSIVDDSNHYKIYRIIADYTNKKITRETAATMLGNCNISDYKTYTQKEIVKVIESIITPQSKINKKKSYKSKGENAVATTMTTTTENENNE